MFRLELTQEQLTKIEGLVDFALRSGGLNLLVDAVNIINLLKTAKPVTFVNEELINEINEKEREE